MPKIDKSNLSKEEWHKIRDARRLEKEKNKLRKEREKRKKIQDNKKENPPKPTPRSITLPYEGEKVREINYKANTAFVIGNGTSRQSINLEELYKFGNIYACNAIYREFDPDYLVAVDVKMINEINRAKYQYKNPNVWTNPNKSFNGMRNLNYFRPSKGWSSGPTALWLASQHNYRDIYILGFDYKGLENGKRLNNIYADTENYKKSHESATFFGNWLRQTTSVVRDNSKKNYYRVIHPDNYIPDELNNYENIKHIFIEDFKKMFNLS